MKLEISPSPLDVDTAEFRHWILGALGTGHHLETLKQNYRVGRNLRIHCIGRVHFTIDANLPYLTELSVGRGSYPREGVFLE